jgi:hypothetical protein
VSRAAFVGACYGALHGAAALEADGSEGGVPLPWVSLLHDGALILKAARAVVDLRGAIAGKATEDAYMGA